MNSLTINNEQTMSSLEIAELVESRHDKVKQSIERLAARGVIQLPPMAEVKNHKGQSVKVYQVRKRDSFIVVAQLSPEFTARLVDRWQELEAKNRPAIPRTYSEALKLAYEQSLDICKVGPENEISTLSLLYLHQCIQLIG